MFLRNIRDHAGFFKAARSAGIHPSTARRRMEADAAFAEAVEDARQECADQLAADMVEQARSRGNPVGFIVQLKALRPDHYIERQAITNTNVNVDVQSPTFAEMERYLVHMMRYTTPATRRLLGLPPADTDADVPPGGPEPA